MSNVKSDYLGQVFNVSEFALTVDKALMRAREIMVISPFDSIAFTGTSGSAMAYILSREMGIPLICIRKETENSHYVKDHGLFEGFVAAKKYLFVDDFISSGSTFRNVRKAIEAKIPTAKCVAALMYTSYREVWDHYVGGNEYIKVYSSMPDSDNARQLRLSF